VLRRNTNGRREEHGPCRCWIRGKGCSEKTQREIEIALVIGTAIVAQRNNGSWGQ